MTTIGIFDSGIGGLSLVSTCREALGRHRVLYVADTLHQPYGQKTAAQVLGYSLQICDFFKSQGAQAILAACSTASAVAVPDLQKNFSVPVFGLLHDGWVEEALARTRNHKIGILATTLTTQMGSFARALRERAPENAQIFSQAAPTLIDQISEGLLEEKLLLPAIRRDLDGLLCRGIDTLIVGCTHFNFILPQLKRVAGDGVEIVNPRDWAVKKLAEVAGRDLLPGEEGGAYYVTGDRGAFQALARKLWRPDAEFQALELLTAARS